jgi:iron complex transport system ATP-binding protein
MSEDSRKEKKEALEVNSISFTYEGDGEIPENNEKPVFQDLSLSLPAKVVSFLGQNGTGKSTLLLLSSARLLPRQGEIFLFGEKTTDIFRKGEEEKNRYASFIYQNMEFETEEPIGDLLEWIHANGFWDKKDPRFINTLISNLDLSSILTKKTQEISKGELQRTIVAFSLLYGSKSIMMDEPIFAMEDHHKERIMGFLTEFAQEYQIPVYYSVHELAISREYSELVLLFYKDGRIRLVESGELQNKALLEEIYEIPYQMLHKKEQLFREQIKAVQEEFSLKRE